MATFTVRPEGIISQPALTMPGNATGSEAACTALTGSQIRALCGLGTTDTPTFGGLTLNGHVLMSPTNTYDIGNGTYDPRTVRAATSVLTPLLNNTNAAALIVGNSTYGVMVPGPLGVNTATPGNNFSVVGTAASPLLSNKTRGVASFVTDVALSGVQLNVGGYASGNYGIWLQTLYQPLSQAYPLLLNPLGGVVGVGTPTPTAPFEVHGSVQDQPICVFQNTGTNTSGGGIAFITNSTQPAARNWAIGFNKVAYGDFSIIQSNAKNGAPLSAGTSRLYIDASGNITFSGDISMRKTSAQGYVKAFNTAGTYSLDLYHNGTGIIASSGGNITIAPASGTLNVTGVLTTTGAIQETYRTSSLDPTVSDIGSGKRQGWYNTTATEFRDWVNVGGTLYKSAAYT